ncbi:RagB/SusD family nutrient uptake outer membrane protein [Sphingobacterium sp.]|uniref:RagB/SusD family nutrient uptake outer membrane protein n=1 Tax=Sphingobacterium sp. TaxID=341027 RepID=UPI0028AD1AA6|nr:RagB/SusD family nutrient uptake outer membrane protein [Sphingobacterium sp.]
MKKHLLTFGIIQLLLMGSCSMEDFLDEKPESTMLVPHEMTEFQFLLNHPRMNYYSVGLGVLSSDDVHYSQDALNTLSPLVRSTYLWEKDMFAGEREIKDWEIGYYGAFTANNVLEGMERVSAPKESREDLIGQALYKRAFAYFDLAVHFCPVYSLENRDLPGLPLKLEADVNIVHQRASLGTVFDAIISDLERALRSLSPQVPMEDRGRPSVQAAHALLSRIYLYMGDYPKAYAHADSCLMISDGLLDFHRLDTTAIKTSWIHNPELIYDSKSANYLEMRNSMSSLASVSSDLYAAYGEDDLRRAVYFRKKRDGKLGMNQNYLGSYEYPLSGLTVGEVYLNFIEAALQTGKRDGAVVRLRQFLSKRYRFPVTEEVFSDSGDLLVQVKQERRKELAWRSTRWMDLKRFNRDGDAIRLHRSGLEKKVDLGPNSPLYVFPIPQSEIDQSNIQQNIR